MFIKSLLLLLLPLLACAQVEREASAEYSRLQFRQSRESTGLECTEFTRGIRFYI